MEERRRPVLTDTDLEEIEKRFARHKCTLELHHADAVFLRQLRQGTESTASMVWKGVLALVFVGLLALAGLGLWIQGYKLLKGIAG